MVLNKTESKKFLSYKNLSQTQKKVIKVTAGILIFSNLLWLNSCHDKKNTHYTEYNTPTFNSTTPSSSDETYIQHIPASSDETSIQPTPSSSDETIKEEVTIEEPTNKKYVALTYDDGPTPGVTTKILEILRLNDSNATFFVLGQRAERFPDIVLEAYLDGNEIGNHGYDHTSFRNLSHNQIMQQIHDTDKIIFDIIGVQPTFIRPPYGATSSQMATKIDRPIAMWNIDSRDWQIIPDSVIIDNIMSNLSDGSIILLHDLHSRSARISKYVIPIIIEEDYTIVSLEQLFEIQKAKVEPGKLYYKVNK